MLQAIYYFFVIFKFMYQTVNAVANSQIRQSYQKGGYYKKEDVIANATTVHKKTK